MHEISEEKIRNNDLCTYLIERLVNFNPQNAFPKKTSY